MSTRPQHAYTGPALPVIPEPTHAERTRTLLHLNSLATLSTLSRKQPGFPFGSLMPYALDDAGRPLFLISNMAMHTQNLKADPRASLFVTQPAADGDPLGAARATLIGNILQVPEEDKAAVRELYLARHENSPLLGRLRRLLLLPHGILDVYYVGGFGVMGWVTAADYALAVPDPLADSAQGILAHMNADHIDAMILLARTHSQTRSHRSHHDRRRSPRLSSPPENRRRHEGHSHQLPQRGPHPH